MHRRYFAGLTAVASAFLCVTTSAQDITTGLIAHWAFDELPGATTAVDSAGGFNGSVQGTISTGVPGRVGRAYSFPDVAGDRVLTTATATNLGLNSGAFSMFAFIKTPAADAFQRHIISALVSGQVGRWSLGVVETFGSTHWFHNGGLGSQISDFDVDDDQWHLVGISKTADGAYTTYTDNLSLAEGTTAAPLADAMITLGARPISNNFMFEGLIDDVRIYNRVLSAADIQALLDQPFPTFTFPSGDYNNNGTVDALDYVLWRMNENTFGTLDNDEIGGEIGPAHYAQWAENFGNGLIESGAGHSFAVPEPATLLLSALVVTMWLASARRR